MPLQRQVENVMAVRIQLKSTDGKELMVRCVNKADIYKRKVFRS